MSCPTAFTVAATSAGVWRYWPGLGGEDILKRDTYAVGLAEFRKLKKRFPLTGIGIGTFGDLVRTQRTAMLNENAGTDAVTEDGQRLGGIDLVTAGHRIHEIGGHQPVHGVAEIELFRERHEPFGALLDDAAACDQIEAGHSQFNGVAANIGQCAQIVFKGGQFAVVRAGVKTGTNKIAHVVISRGKEVYASSGSRAARRTVSKRSGRSTLT